MTPCTPDPTTIKAVPMFTLAVEQTRTGLWLVTSPEIRGLLVAKHSRRDALMAVATAISELEDVSAGLIPSPRPAAQERCECGQMLKKDCDGLPSLRHCGKFSDRPPARADRAEGGEDQRAESATRKDAGSGAVSAPDLSAPQSAASPPTSSTVNSAVEYELRGVQDGCRWPKCDCAKDAPVVGGVQSFTCLLTETSPASSPEREAGALLPCPFCSVTPVFSPESRLWRHPLNDCTVLSNEVIAADNNYAKIASWNRRAFPAPGMDALDRVGLTNNRGAEPPTAAADGQNALLASVIDSALGLPGMLRQIADELDETAEKAPCSEAGVCRDAAKALETFYGRTVVRPAGEGLGVEWQTLWASIEAPEWSAPVSMARAIGDYMAQALDAALEREKFERDVKEEERKHRLAFQERAEAAERRVAELEAADVKRAQDICKYTMERDEAREKLQACERVVEAARKIKEKWLAPVAVSSMAIEIATLCTALSTLTAKQEKK